MPQYRECQGRKLEWVGWGAGRMGRSQLLTYKGLQTLPPSRVLSLQVALIEDPTLTFQSCLPLNISNLLPQLNTDHSPSHSCTETLEELLPHPSHIQEGTLPQAIYTWYTDGSSFLHEGDRRASYAIISDTEVVEAQPLSNPGCPPSPPLGPPLLRLGTEPKAAVSLEGPIRNPRPSE